ncbi:MAG: large repetitive protein [Acidobacteriota bacterium]|jgi:uncharacterized repeat protein (TIGR01451 family)|nr:large repetitive protein [Acidobacteriota bacterium]
MRRAGSNAPNPVTPASVNARSLVVALSRWRLLLVVLAIFLLGSVASAQTNIYQMRGSPDYGIYVYNTTTNTETTVYKPYPVNPAGTNSATLAQRPSDGMLFYVMYTGANNPVMYSFNPATPNIAPVQVGTGLGGAVPSSLRMAFSPAGVLYYLPDSRLLYTIDTTTGIATSTGVTAGAAITSGGDMGFTSAGTLYVVTSSKLLYTVSTATGTATQVGNAAINFPDPDPNATIGLAFDSAGRLLVQTQNANNIYSVALPVANNATPQGTLVHTGDGDTASTGDMASANVPAPNLTITKTDNATTVYRGGPVSYTIVVTNNGAYTVAGNVTDVVPASITSVTWTCVASAGSTCAAANGSGNNISTSATLEAGDTATYTVSGTVSPAASGSLINQASVALQSASWLIESNLADNSASDNDTINLNANLGITKTDSLATVNPGANVTYTIVVSNAGPDTATGAVVTDTVPASLSSVTWTCGSPVNGATCGAASGSGNSISTTANLPASSSVTYLVSGTLSNIATGTLSNTATVLAPASGVTDPTDPTRTGAGNNSATDTTTINAASNLAVTKTVNNATPNVGNTVIYTLTVTNNGPSNATNVRLTDVVPAGLTYVSSTPSGSTTYNSATGLWTIGSLANAASATLVINATVNVGPGNNTITNTTSGLAADQFDPVSANNVGSVSLRVTRSDLSLTKTVNNATPSFGQSVIFTITLSNAGPDGATGVAVKDLLPAGLAFSSYTATVGSYVSGTGIWTVGSLASGGSATLQITATVNAYGSITNTAQVSATDQSDPDSTPNNNVAAEDDQASVSVGATPPNIALCKTIVGQTCPPPAILPTQSPGTDINYILTFTNSGGSPASSLIITDPYIDPVLPVASRLKINDHTYFKVGSIVNTLPAGLSIISVKYSNDSGVTWTYTPVSGGGGAPAGYDANVTHIQWNFGGSLSQNALSNSGNVQFAVRIK